MRDEELPADWPICGTTGYDFLNLVNGLFVDRRGAGKLVRIYGNFIGQPPSFRDVVYHSKLTILSTSMASELYVLAGQLERISERHRWWRDFTRSTLHRALQETIACFPVYRTYIRPATREVRDDDRHAIQTAIRTARRRNPSLSPAIFDFLASVLLLEYPEGLGDDDRQPWEQFVLEFQQVTGPVMAKGYEDTAFYRWNPLAALNEVGGDPAATGVTTDRFHARVQQQAARWPLSMLATATHDTKRGEDLRARLNVLSEIPEAWEEAVSRWQSLNEAHRGEIEGSPVPDANEEYLLYQTLVGTWPVLPQDETARTEYAPRIAAYMAKAMKEAKIHTSWANPNESYEQAVEAFVRAVLDEGRSRPFLEDLAALVHSIAAAGWINSLAQCVLKIAAPGVPDFYQGCEVWDFHLVDPDNRRAVDFDHRKRLLAELQARAAVDLPGLAAELLSRWPDERLKMFVAWRALGFRRETATLLLEGQYVPLAARGPRGDSICAFARQSSDRWAIAVAPRLDREAAGPGLAAWFDGTRLDLPAGAPRHWRHVFTGRGLAAEEAGSGNQLDLVRLFAQFPVAILQGESE
jgi:(1->4)-alpha-D-glucan 1-alpha-D-glucosylmutase